MPQRITIVLSDETAKKVRGVQSKQILTVDHSVSFSSVVEQLLIVGLKK